MTQKPPIIITGFEPFGADPTNPSWAVARAAARVSRARPVLLPVTYAKVEEFARSRPASVAVFAVGLRAMSPAVAVEHVGSRIAGRNPDNGGVVVDGPLIAGAPDAYRVGVVAEELSSALRATCELEVEDSTDAGGYVCNALLYHLLHARARGGPLGAFIHVPKLDNEPAQLLGQQLGNAINRLFPHGGT